VATHPACPTGLVGTPRASPSRPHPARHQPGACPTRSRNSTVATLLQPSYPVESERCPLPSEEESLTVHNDNENDNAIDYGIFEERAEYLTRQELYDWTATSKQDSHLLEKLKGPGAKLLTGPRGSGKSTILRRAYYDLAHNKSTLGVYVNYSKSLALEPLFHRTANAPQLFRQWVLAKVVEGVYETFREIKKDCPNGLYEQHQHSVTLIQLLETGQQPETIDYPQTPTALLASLTKWTEGAGRSRTVLLFDDAAHAFSLEQQRDFFEIFRELRSRTVSAKAAIYPGITSFSPNLHVGHEAELLELWYKPDQPDYLDFMWEIFNRRMPQSVKNVFRDRQESVNVLALAANGMPRGFLNMLSDTLRIEESGTATPPTRKMVLDAISEHAETTRAIFGSLSSKLPRFRHYVEVGKELENSIIEVFRKYNSEKPANRKATIIAIAEPIPPELDKILKFLQYAGLLRAHQSVSRGVKGVFQRFSLNYAIIIAENALSLGKTYSLKKLVGALSGKDAHAFVRTRATTLLGDDFADRCVLDLPPCTRCGQPRLKEEQKFCMNCGSELSDASVYQELLNAPIDDLPLTAKKLESIKKNTSIRKVQDLLTDDDQEIRKAHYIGRIWANRIRTYAEEFVSV
jgi:hypothetical protein